MNIDVDLDMISQLDPVIHKDGVVTVDGFLTGLQCQQFIDSAESGGFAEAMVRMEAGARMLKSVRNNDRFIIDDFELADSLWPAVELFVDAFDLDIKPVALNERFRFYRYSPSQRFKRHRDGEERIRGLLSRITFLVYLNDDYEGGATVFSEYKFHDGQRSDEIVTVAPKIGKALLFQHHLWHEGEEVIRGRKYVMRTDVLCDPDVTPSK